MFSFWCCGRNDSSSKSKCDKPETVEIINPAEDGTRWLDTVVKKENYCDYLRILRKTRKGAKGELTRFFICKNVQCTSEDQFEMYSEGVLKTMLPIRFSDPELVGAGGQGIVLTVCDSDSEQKATRIALKLVYFGNRKFLSFIRICREIQIGKISSHPNICRLLEVFSPEEPESLSYVIFLFDKVQTTLSEVLRACSLNRRPSHQTTSTWLYQLLSAVQFLHDRNIIHRDLKPSNVGMTSSYRQKFSSFSEHHCDEIKLLDMGMARGIEGDRPLTPGLGTYSYMAPELLLENHINFEGIKLSKHNKVNSRPVGVYEKTCGFHDYDKSVDIWALGVMFAEMLLADGSKFFQSYGVETTGDMVKILVETIKVCTTADYKQYIGEFNSTWLDEICSNTPIKLSIDDRLRENLMPHDEDDLTHLNGKNARDLINRMLQWNPKDRISAAEALRHPYFSHLYLGTPLTEVQEMFRDNVHPASFLDERMADKVEETVLKDMKCKKAAKRQYAYFQVEFWQKFHGVALIDAFICSSNLFGF